MVTNLKMTKALRREVAEVLTEARALLARPYGWTQGAFVRWMPTREYDCFCAIGALNAATHRVAGFTPGDAYWGANRALSRALNTPPGSLTAIMDFNDAKTTRKKDVLALFDRAIESVSA